MPLYQYTCEECKEKVDLQRKISDRDLPINHSIIKDTCTGNLKRDITMQAKTPLLWKVEKVKRKE